MLKATITDVAQRAGVSIKTVSRVLNGEPNVRQKTQEKVREAAKALHYTPNLSARSLAGNKSYLLALVYDNPSYEYIAQLQKGAMETCRKRGYHLVVEPLRADGEDIAYNVELLLARLPVDGVILPSPLCDNEVILGLLKRAGTDVIKICPRSAEQGGLDDGSLSLQLDDASASYEMTNYLISQGHKDIGFIRGNASHGSASLREQGYRRALQDAKIAIDEALIVDGDYTFASGKLAAQQLLSGAKVPSAIFASNDEAAAGSIFTAHERGLSIPEQLSVCGFDDTSLASMLFPPLTTVRQPIIEIGQNAAQLLIDMNSNKPALDEAVLPISYELIIRGSTDKKGGLKFNG